MHSCRQKKAGEKSDSVRNGPWRLAKWLTITFNLVASFLILLASIESTEFGMLSFAKDFRWFGRSEWRCSAAGKSLLIQFTSHSFISTGVWGSRRQQNWPSLCGIWHLGRHGMKVNGVNMDAITWCDNGRFGRGKFSDLMRLSCAIQFWRIRANAFNPRLMAWLAKQSEW